MKLYLDTAAIIIDLHERGFTEDFIVVGDQILWVQRKAFFKPTDFSLIEAHSFLGGDGTELLILGASLLPYFSDGILVWQFEKTSDWRPALISNKLNELMIRVPVSDNSVCRFETN